MEDQDDGVTLLEVNAAAAAAAEAAEAGGGGAAGARELGEDDRETLERYREFQRAHQEAVPAYLRDVYGDSCLLNFQIVSFYRAETQYLFLFRLAFALIYFSVPFTVSALLLWAELTDRSTANLVQLLLVSAYTGPLLARGFAELKKLSPYVGVPRLLLIQADTPLVLFLYVASAATNHSDGENSLPRFLTSLGIAVPSFVAYVYLSARQLTVYAYGMVDLFLHIPRVLLTTNYALGTTPLTKRLRNLRADLAGVASSVARVPTRLARRSVA